MSSETVKYVVEHICWLPSYGLEMDTDGEAKVTNDLDDRTKKKKSFDAIDEAHEYIDIVRKQEGKWLANITLRRVHSVEVPLT